MVLVPELLYNVFKTVSNGHSDCSSSCTIYNVVKAVIFTAYLSGVARGLVMACMYVVYMLSDYLYIYSDGIGSRASL